MLHSLKLIFILLFLAFPLLSLQAKNYHLSDQASIDLATSYQEQINTAAFSFAIFSDNEGDAPASMKSFSHMVKWVHKDKDSFVIGLGDHVKKKDKPEFINFLHKNSWWNNNFYPCAADGENQYYGSGQADWGTGGKFFKEVNLEQRPDVVMRKNGVEYYAKIPVKEWTIHLIQLHYPDQPQQDSLAFREDSKDYLMRTLASIEKKDKDIIIVGAHSRTGFWIDQLDSEQKKTVMEKCDLVLSATTHYFMRKDATGYNSDGALVINTGSITHPFGCPAGYVQVLVFDNPHQLWVEYVDAGMSKREELREDYTFVKDLFTWRPGK